MTEATQASVPNRTDPAIYTRRGKQMEEIDARQAEIRQSEGYVPIVVEEEKKEEVRSEVKTEAVEPKAEEKTDAETKQAEPVTPASEQAADAQKTEEKVVAQPEASQPVPQGQPAQPPLQEDGSQREDPLVTIKVDGQARQVRQSDLVANFQKNQAADSRLAQAARILDQMRAQQAQLQAQTPPQRPEDKPAALSEPKDEDWQDLVKKLQYADTAEAATSLKGFIGRLRPSGQSAQPAIDPEQIKNEILNRTEFDMAVRKFGEEYTDINKDSNLAVLAGTIARGLLTKDWEDSQREGRQRRPFYDTFKAAGEHIRQWAKSLPANVQGQTNPDNNQQKVPAQPVVSMSQDRTDQKKAAPRPPSPRATTPAPLDESAREKTDLELRRDAIKDMQRARKKTVY